MMNKMAVKVVKNNFVLYGKVCWTVVNLCSVLDFEKAETNLKERYI